MGVEGKNYVCFIFSIKFEKMKYLSFSYFWKPGQDMAIFCSNDFH